MMGYQWDVYSSRDGKDYLLHGTYANKQAASCAANKIRRLGLWARLWRHHEKRGVNHAAGRQAGPTGPAAY